MGKTSVWPSDFLDEPHELERCDANHLIVFLICPFRPEEQFRELLDFCNEVCADVGESIGALVQCVRADSFATPKVIHEDIWSAIQMADALIADVSGTNGNVMLELGVAAAVREKDQVIVIHDQESEYEFLFDIRPARHLSYRRSVRGDSVFRKRLSLALLYALAPAPYVPPSFRQPRFPLDVDLTGPGAVPFLLSPGNAHRKQTVHGLEFGSFFVFRYSYVSLGANAVGAIHIRADMRFSDLRPEDELGAGWIGIMLRGQHFLANFGHLVYVISNGEIRYTKPLSEFRKEEPDPVLGSIPEFELNDWITFELKFDDSGICGNVGGVAVNIPAQDMPFVHNGGLLRLQTSRCRSVLKKLHVERLD